MIRIIAAISINGVIGVNNSIPWSFKDDMNFFRKMTSDSIVIMGRKTFESITKPLVKRRNIIITKKIKPIKDVEISSSIKNAIDMCESDNRDIWLIGGESIYAEGMEFASEIYLTMIPKWIDTEQAESVARFPWINPQIFQQSEDIKLSDELTVIKYTKK